MTINRYSYEDLVQKALQPNASQEDINALGAWFENYGTDYWNGECYSIDASHDLYPIYEQVEEDQFDIVGYEVR